MKAKIRRVLMTADTVGGVWTYVQELVRALGEHEVEVGLATMGGPVSLAPGVGRPLPENVVQLFESNFRLEWMESPWKDVATAGEWLLGIEALLRPDVVHLNSYVHAALPWRAPTLVVGHSCICSWFASVKRQPLPASWGRYRSEVTQGLQSADAVTAPTRSMLMNLEEHYGLFRAAPVVYNGRRAQDFLPGRKEPLVFSAGRLWDEGKNLAAVARVATRLAWPVYVAGEHLHPGNGVEVRLTGVTCLGRLTQPALSDWMGRASIFALPARYEPFGLSALEAALAGCALVLGDIPSLREVWADAACFVSPDDDEALAAALEGLIADGARRAALAARARDRALTFTPQRMAQGYMALYRDLL